jgi:hypothetical protein
MTGSIEWVDDGKEEYDISREIPIVITNVVFDTEYSSQEGDPHQTVIVHFRKVE